MKDIIITIADKYFDKIPEIVEYFKSKGLEVTNVFEFGVVTGRANEETINYLRNLNEVAVLQEDTLASIPPPESEIQ